MGIAETFHRFFETGPWGLAFERLTSAPEPPRCLLVKNGSSTELLLSQLPPCSAGSLRIVAISDTHGKHRLLTCPAADVLVHCGDLLSRNACVLQNNGQNHRKGRAALRDFNQWLGEQSQCRTKIVIGGNHDATLEAIGDERAKEVLNHAIYLHDSATEVDGLRFYGSPWSRGKSANRAFQAEAPPAMTSATLEQHIDVLVCHCFNEGLVQAARPSLVLSGHAHAMYGILQTHPCIALNASICDKVYRTAHWPVVIDINVMECTAQRIVR